MQLKQKLRNARDLSETEVRKVLVERMRGTSGLVISLIHNIHRGNVLSIERGRYHHAIYKAVHKMPAAKRLREIGKLTDRESLREARKLLAEIVNSAKPHDAPHK
jgi:hypothetical protein